MLKLNFLAFTLMIQVRKQDDTENGSNYHHEQRLKEIGDRNLDRRTQIKTFM